MNSPRRLFNVAQTIVINGQLVIDKSLTITGRGANLTTIRNVAAVSETSRVFLINSGTTVNLSGMTITGGNVTNDVSSVSDLGGGINNSGTLTINCAVTGNINANIGNIAGIGPGGGGIYSGDGSSLTIIGSTISGNTSSRSIGGGINNRGMLTIINTTISGNSASVAGGIHTITATLTNSTITGNSCSSAALGGGGGIISASPFSARNTIISGNTAPSNPDVSGTLNVNENNLIGGDARLLPLGNYGGATQTHALYPDSPAINAGNNCVLAANGCSTNVPPTALTADQRGRARVGQVDIGAFELNNSQNGGNFRILLPAGTRGSEYSYTLFQNSGALTYTANGLPPGIVLSNTSGVVRLSGTPTQSGAFDFSVTASDGINSNVTDYSLIIQPSGSALTFTVTKIADTNDGVCSAADCSLREAIQAAESGETIAFSALFNSAQTITLALGELVINKPLTVNGTGANLLTVSGNNASRVLNIFQAGTVALNNLTVTRGSTDNGGGVVINNTIVNLNNCAVTGSAATGLGGDIFNVQGTVNLTNSTVSGNAAAIGGGIANGGAPSLLNVTNSTISGNVSNGLGGGGIFASGAVTVINLTITNNRALGDGVNSGIGGGISNYTLEPVSLLNTVIAGNYAPTAPDFRDTLNSLGYNLIGDLSGTILTGDGTGNLLNASPQLLPLSDNGGATQTHALLPNSPAVNAGTAEGAPNTDQRGRARFGTTDIGAYESAANIFVTNTANTGAGSLREAIAATNATTADESISFAIPPNDAGCTNGVCTINLGGTQLTINSQTTAGRLLIHNRTGAMNLRVSGNNQSRVFDVVGGANLIINGLTVTGGNVSSDTGGGIRNLGGSLTILNSAVTGNVSNFGGGGINTQNGILIITGSTISGNQVAGNQVSGGDGGGGIRKQGGTVTITNSTISGNSSGFSIAGAPTGGGGILSKSGGGTMTITNSTVTGNTAAGSANTNGGGINNGSGTLNLINTIISANILNAANSSPDLAGSINMNISNQIGGNAHLAPLGFYGGQTMTHALLSGSPAINAGTSANAPSTDQRGAARVGNTDIGAFELNNSANGGNYAVDLPNGRQATNYSFVITQNNNAFAYTVTDGALPNGINLSTGFAPETVVALTGTPEQAGVFNFQITASDGMNSNVTNYRLNIVAPTAAGVSISGRVFAGKGRGLMNAAVSVTGQNGEIRTTRTNSSGYYRFDNIAAGQTIIFSVTAKRYRFAPQIVSIAEELDELNFYPEP